ncbi:ecdysteroid kinase domain-containing protein [Ditylenchus destructor]|nr:ecdysteroid kinase domain-containing protein [Ditylenchus destructor]
MIDTINGTPFTIQFVIAKLRDAGINGGCLPKNLIDFDVKDITNGSAFMSHIYKLTFHWKSDIGLPQTLILKVPGVANANDFASKAIQEGTNLTVSKDILDLPQDQDKTEIFLEAAHSKEILFYQLFSSYDKGIGLKIPTFYYGFEYSRKHTNGLIIMEDMTPVAITTKMIPGFNDQQVLALTSELARFHSASWMHPDWTETISNGPIPQSFIDHTVELTRTLKQIKPEWFDKLVDAVMPCFTIEWTEAIVYNSDKYGFPPSVVHGDLWASNVLWQKDEQNNATSEVAAIIDWQMVHAGNPAEDLARLLCVNTSGEYRRKNTKRVLQHYTEKVTEFLGRPLFTLDQIMDAYNHALPFITLQTGFGAPMYYNMDSVVGTGADRDSNRLELLSRTRMVFEDTLDFLCSHNL